jgi:ABC-type multidrug transport system fused ATPase/permease subunit
MRRGIASLLMGLSLVLASAGWAGLTLSSTVLDPKNSDPLARQLLEDPSVRSVLVDRLGDGMANILPESEPMSRQELSSAAEEALNDSATTSAIQTALAEAHRLGLAGEEDEVYFAHFDSNEAARLALIAERPSLGGQILVNPLVRIELPTSGLSWLAGLKSLVDRFTIVAIAIAVAGFAAAFVVARDAAATMRRAAWWILGAAAFWTLAAIGFGATAGALTPSSYVLMASSIDSFFASMRSPAVIMTTFGLGMLAISTVVPALDRRRGAQLLAKAQRDSGLARDTTNTSRSASSDRADSKATKAERLTAAWQEGHGYLDDARVAPFLGQASELVTTGGDHTRAGSRTDNQLG